MDYDTNEIILNILFIQAIYIKDLPKFRYWWKELIVIKKSIWKKLEEIF